MLVNRAGRLALGDLGLSAKRPNGVNGGFLKPVCTLLYQAPEQLFLARNGYNEKADVWSLGCIFYELLTGWVLFSKAKSKEQLIHHFLRDFGCESFDKWEAGCETDLVRSNKHLMKKNKTIFANVRSQIQDQDALNLLERMMELNPDHRLSAEEVLRHPYLASDDAGHPNEP